MSQIIVGSDFTGTLDITNLTGATEHALVVGAADGSLTSLAVAGNGELPIGSVGADPVLTTITAGANINVVNDPGAITISATGVGPDFADNVFRVYDNIDNNKLLAFECDQINTGTTRTITMCDQDLSLINPAFPGTVTSGGNLTITAGNFNMPVTNAAFTEGTWRVGGQLFMHNLGVRNTFFGDTAGSALTTGEDCTSLGFNSLYDITNGDFNTCLGSYAGQSITVGSSNTCIGMGSLDNVTTGNQNIAIGFNAGSNNTLNDSDNIYIGNVGTVGDDNKIRIGTQGTGSGQQNNTFIAGIHGVTPGGVAQTAIIDANGELGTLGAATDGQIPIGSTGANQVLATLTEGADIGITNGAGTITISYTGSTGVAWSEVTGTTQAAAVDSGYITNNAAQVVVTLPDTAALGSIVRICGKGAGGWKLAQNAGDTIYWDSAVATTTGAAGYLESTDYFDTVEVVCITADTDWKVLSGTGNITVA